VQRGRLHEPGNHRCLTIIRCRAARRGLINPALPETRPPRRSYTTPRDPIGLSLSQDRDCQAPLPGNECGKMSDGKSRPAQTTFCRERQRDVAYLRGPGHRMELLMSCHENVRWMERCAAILNGRRLSSLGVWGASIYTCASSLVARGTKAMCRQTRDNILRFLGNAHFELVRCDVCFALCGVLDLTCTAGSTGAIDNRTCCAAL
jgi:hypothetical protein